MRSAPPKRRPDGRARPARASNVFSAHLRACRRPCAARGVDTIGQLLSRFVAPLCARPSAHVWVDAQREQLLLSVEAELQAPQLAARRRDLEVQTAAVEQALRLVGGLRLANSVSLRAMMGVLRGAGKSQCPQDYPQVPQASRGTSGTLGHRKRPRSLILLGPSVLLGLSWIQVWSRRQESNLYLPLRRRPFYPLNYGERAARILACVPGGAGRAPGRSQACLEPVEGPARTPSGGGPGYSPGRGLHSLPAPGPDQVERVVLPDCARSVNRRAIR